MSNLSLLHNKNHSLRRASTNTQVETESMRCAVFVVLLLLLVSSCCIAAPSLCLCLGRLAAPTRRIMTCAPFQTMMARCSSALLRRLLRSLQGMVGGVPMSNAALRTQLELLGGSEQLLAHSVFVADSPALLMRINAMRFLRIIAAQLDDLDAAELVAAEFVSVRTAFRPTTSTRCGAATTSGCKGSHNNSVPSLFGVR